MENRAIFRAGGLVCIVSGILLPLGVILHFPIVTPLAHTVYMIALVWFLFATVVLYTVQARQTGVIGMGGFGLAILGLLSALISGFFTMLELAGSSEAHNVFMFAYVNVPIFMIGAYAVVMGFLLLGIATLYSGILSRWAGALIALGAVVNLPAELVMSMMFLWPIAAALTGAGLIWIGGGLVTGQYPAAAPALPEFE